jgi:beta-mannosidase
MARNVYLQWEGTEGFFSENYFDLLPGEERKVTFSPKAKGQLPEEGKLRVKTLVDTY